MNECVFNAQLNKGMLLDYLFSIQHDLLELAGLSEALDDLVGDVSSEVHTKSEGWVGGLHQVSQLL